MASQRNIFLCSVLLCSAEVQVSTALRHVPSLLCVRSHEERDGVLPLQQEVGGVGFCGVD